MMWKPLYNVIVAFPIEESQAAPSRKALRWGCMNILPNEIFVAEYEGQQCEIRTYQFTTEDLRQRFKAMVISDLGDSKVLLAMEDEAARKWVPDIPYIPGY